MTSTKYELKSVGTDGDAIAKAWVLKNQDWNGFVIPVFDKENALKVAKATDLLYDEDTNTFSEKFNPDYHDSEDDLEKWQGGLNEELGFETYAIGAGSWTWGIADAI